MKNLTITLIVLAFFLSVEAQESTKKSRKEFKEEKQAEQIKKVSELIENKTFVFSALKAVPLCGDPVSLEYLYSAKIENGIISSYLPFYGIDTEYKIENSPLIFTKHYNEYSIQKENDKYEIQFNIPAENDIIKFRFKISKFGFAQLKVTSTQFQGISFLGFIDENVPTVFSSN